MSDATVSIIKKKKRKEKDNLEHSTSVTDLKQIAQQGE